MKTKMFLLSTLWFVALSLSPSVPAVVAREQTASFQIPPTDEGLPGSGPIRRSQWFQKLWQQRRSRWANEKKQDQGAVVFLGDSITQGWGAQLGRAFREMKVANRGISGDTTRGVLIRLDEDVLSLDPKAIVLLIGTNDLEDGATPGIIAGNVALIVKQLKAHNAKMPIVLCKVFPSSETKKRPADQIKIINQLYSNQFKNDPQVTLVDTWSLFAGPQGNAKREEFPDLLHPNRAGYAKWAAALMPVFKTVGIVETFGDRQLLWPSGAPGAKGNDPSKDQPAITIYSPPEETNTGTAVIICPGGGYGHLAMGHEGLDIAKWFNAMGVTGVVLEYRMSKGGYQHPIPLLDVQRAIRTVRYRADSLHLNPSHIGVMGFSAGGHLASTAGTHFDKGDPKATDPIDQVDCRPDFMILCYPVIAFGESFTHKGSQRNLIGAAPSKELITSLSNEKQVTADTPPAFLFHTDEDTGVPAENSVFFYLALRKAGVPAELHIYRKGGHGVGLARKIPGTHAWPETCQQWLKGQGLLEKLPAQ